jgi:predicted small lipoprotein YifL
MAARNTRVRTAILLLCLAGATGCGQKGALYLPEAQRPVVVSPATPAPTPEEESSSTSTQTDATKRQESGRNPNQN